MDHEEPNSPSEMAVDSYVPPEEDEAPGGEDDSDAPVTLDDESRPGVPVMADVRADNVTLSQGGAQSIEAHTVSITQGGAGRVRADAVTVNQGGIGLAQAEQLTVAPQASAFAVVADEAMVQPGANIFLLISRKVSGEVRPVLDWRGVVALLLGFGLVLLVLRRAR